MDRPPHVIDLGDLILRRFARDADLPELWRVIEESSEHLRPWMAWVAGHDRAATARFLDRRHEAWEEGRDFTYAIVREGAVVGACQLFRRDGCRGEGLEAGYWLHPRATGRGLATRAVRALVEEAFRLPGVEHVDIVHDLANRASGAVPERLGFSRHRRRPAERTAPAESGEEQVWRLTLRQARARAAQGARGAVAEG
ncbi:GNAT family N-acetyltransferase [Streptomyces sp. NPDC008265]|uniref:GNAT family N-acetyltransferase n=1 Tax=Streptomyces sp. NPDC008265 TaxID=3364824 RepID=UPI0036E293B3